MDRNFVPNRLLWEHWKVALLAEGVDRNDVVFCAVSVYPESPSSRRAWIEIQICSALSMMFWVALLAEGVDRNEGGNA